MFSSTNKCTSVTDGQTELKQNRLQATSPCEMSSILKATIEKIG